MATLQTECQARFKEIRYFGYSLILLDFCVFSCSNLKVAVLVKGNYVMNKTIVEDIDTKEKGFDVRSSLA